jgi:hypothetical protein
MLYSLAAQKCMSPSEGVTRILLTRRGSWASISRGAAIKSMSYDLNKDQPIPVVTSYISKAHYGMEFKEPFDSLKHTDDDRREFDVDKEMDFAWDQMYWFVNKVRSPFSMTRGNQY